MPFLQGLDFNDWLWIGVMLNITVLRNEVSWRNCFNGLDKYIDLRKDFKYDFDHDQIIFSLSDQFKKKSIFKKSDFNFFS